MFIGKIKNNEEVVNFNIGLAWPSTKILIPTNDRGGERFVCLETFLELKLEWVWLNEKERILQELKTIILKKWNFEPEFEELQSQKQQWLNFIPKMTSWIENQKINV